ncbi:MAG: Clp protease N-terminal domain-containing protein [Miltoncostaeaceae bacterium]
MFARIRRRRDDLVTVTNLLKGAETAARQDGSAHAGAEHLLLAALGLPDGTAAAAFRRAGLDPGGLAGAIASQHAAALGALGITGPEPAVPAPGDPPRGPYRGDASMEPVLRSAAAAVKHDRIHLSGAHIVEAVAALDQGTAPRALAALGADRAALARAAREELAALVAAGR